MAPFSDMSVPELQNFVPLWLNFLCYLFACGDEFGESNLFFCYTGPTDMFGNSE